MDIKHYLDRWVPGQDLINSFQCISVRTAAVQLAHCQIIYRCVMVNIPAFFCKKIRQFLSHCNHIFIFFTVFVTFLGMGVIDQDLRRIFLFQGKIL